MSNIHILCPAPDLDAGTFSRLTERITPHLDRAGICFQVSDTPVSGQNAITIHGGDDPERIARRIIAADGKEFVPITPGECLDEAVRLGLFPSGTRWDSPLTKEDAALLAVRLLHLLRP